MMTSFVKAALDLIEKIYVVLVLLAALVHLLVSARVLAWCSKNQVFCDTLYVHLDSRNAV